MKTDKNKTHVVKQNLGLPFHCHPLFGSFNQRFIVFAPTFNSHQKQRLHTQTHDLVCSSRSQWRSWPVTWRMQETSSPRHWKAHGHHVITHFYGDLFCSLWFVSTAGGAEVPAQGVSCLWMENSWNSCELY